MGRLGVWVIDEYDDVMTSSILHLEPDQKKNPDPDKVIKNHPGFDPVFMKVWCRSRRRWKKREIEINESPKYDTMKIIGAEEEHIFLFPKKVDL